MVRNAAKVAIGLIFLVAVYLLVLLIIGWVAGGVVGGQIQQRLARSLDAEVRVGGAKVGLVFGDVTVRNLEVERTRGLDQLLINVKRLEVDTAPLGWVLIDRSLRHVRVRDARLTITGAGALALPPRPAAPPVQVGGLDIENAVLDLQATGYWPGLARIVVTIERARTGPTTMRTGLSWIFTLEELVARVDLPAGMTVRLGYAQGKLSASGGFFGDTPVTIDFVLPKLDGSGEVAQLTAIGKELLKQLALERARRWIESKGY
jgi:hypothetical protein